MQTVCPHRFQIPHRRILQKFAERLTIQRIGFCAGDQKNTIGILQQKLLRTERHPLRTENGGTSGIQDVATAKCGKNIGGVGAARLRTEFRPVEKQDKKSRSFPSGTAANDRVDFLLHFFTNG